MVPTPYSLPVLMSTEFMGPQYSIKCLGYNEAYNWSLFNVQDQNNGRGQGVDTREECECVIPTTLLYSIQLALPCLANPNSITIRVTSLVKPFYSSIISWIGGLPTLKKLSRPPNNGQPTKGPTSSSQL
ncbi:uncharacterized protein DS421_9g280520 [Arachis hypogaea]|nr:uncharacterized protein DS421_9g280520 [Arachis hypogaea]